MADPPMSYMDYGITTESMRSTTVPILGDNRTFLWGEPGSKSVEQ